MEGRPAGGRTLRLRPPQRRLPGWGGRSVYLIFLKVIFRREGLGQS